MKSSVKTALGIDISEGQISVVVLKRTSRGLKVCSAGQESLDEGILDAGRVIDSADLTRGLRLAKRRHGKRCKQVAMALPIRSTLARVMGLEESDPQRVSRFIKDEVRQYAAFSGRETVADYRVLTPATASKPGKVLVTAADRDATSALTRACDRAGITVTEVEPVVTLWANMFNGANPLKHGTGNRIMALLKDGSLVLCVFRGGVLDFVHAKGIDLEHESMASVHAWVAHEINTVIKFYCLQQAETEQAWGVIVADDMNAEVPPEAEELLKTQLQHDNIVVLTRWNIFQRLGIACQADEEASITAVGLAMRSLTDGQDDARINLLPADATRVRVLKRHALAAAIAFAVIVFGLVLVVGGLNWQVDCVNRRISALNTEELRSGVSRLPAAVAELDAIEGRIEVVSAKLDCINHMSDSRLDVDWANLLTDIGRVVPQVVRIVELTARGDSDILIEGLSKTYQAVQTFKDGLKQLEQIHVTEIKDMRVDNSDQAYVRYEIRCTLVPRKSL